MTKPLDPNYWRNWRKAHPEYRVRERRRVDQRRATFGREDRTTEYAQRKREERVPWEPIPPLHCGHEIFIEAKAIADRFARRDTRIVYCNPLWEDTVSEVVLALIERRDPAAAARSFAVAERRRTFIEAPLFLEIAPD